jgi:magnesium transporter
MFRTPGSIGHAPGTLVPTEGAEQEPLLLTLFEYGPDRTVKERQFHTVAEALPFDVQVPVTWFNVDGSHRAEVLDEIGKHLTIHPLTLEDILDTAQRPKLEIFDQYLFIELNAVLWDQELSQIQADQISLVLGDNYVASFNNKAKDVFDPIRSRLREGAGRLNQHGADYLAYSLIDAIVDHYFVVLENLGEQIEFLEDELVANPDPDILQSIHELKRELIFLRKSVWPLREVIAALERGESPLFQESTQIYLRDVYDHSIQIIDTVETFRDMVSGMLDIYLSSVSNRMNEVMKVLTVIATIFIPLSFIVGLYGMNFEYMPELHWKWGYFGVWGVIILVVVGMVAYFRHKKWF